MSRVNVPQRRVPPNTLSMFGWPISQDGSIPPEYNIGVLGIPCDVYADKRGQAEAPGAIRALPWYDVQHMLLTGYQHVIGDVEGIDLGDIDQWKLTDRATAVDVIDRALPEVNDHQMLVVLGGDDAVSLPVVKFYAKQLVHWDAHTDRWTYPNGELRHGSWVSHLPDDIRVIQPASRVGPGPVDVYVSCEDYDTVVVVDLDAVDTGAAPGVVSPVPGGLAAADLLNDVYDVCRLNRVKAVVVTELCPSRDVNDLTAYLAQQVVQHAIAGHIQRVGTL